MNEDDTFDKLKRPNFEEMYEIYQKNKLSDIPNKLNDLLIEHRWDPKEFRKELWRQKNTLILEIEYDFR